MASSRVRLPPVNATLTEVSIYEFTGYDRDGNEVYDWSSIFTGAAPAYITERNEFVPHEGGRLHMYVAVAVVPSNVGVEVGAKLRFTRRGVELEREVDALEDRADFGFHRCFVREVAR